LFVSADSQPFTEVCDAIMPGPTVLLTAADRRLPEGRSATSPPSPPATGRNPIREILDAAGDSTTEKLMLIEALFAHDSDDPSR